MANEMVKIEKEEGGCCGEVVSKSYYPWGTSLNFENEMIDKLGIGALQPGDVVEIRGYAVIESVSSSADKEDSRKSIGMQLTEITVNRKKVDTDYAKQLYGDQS